MYFIKVENEQGEITDLAFGDFGTVNYVGRRVAADLLGSEKEATVILAKTLTADEDNIEHKLFSGTLDGDSLARLLRSKLTAENKKINPKNDAPA